MKWIHNIIFYSFQFIIFYFRQDLVCHDNQGGFVHVVLGDAYGHPKLSEVKHNPGLRFCYRNNYYPEYLTLLVGEELDIQIYQIISSKAKLDEIFEWLEKLNQIGETVVVPISAKIACLERSISNLGVTPYLDSVQKQLNCILLILPDQDHE